jgi:hypothetical protein
MPSSELVCVANDILLPPFGMLPVTPSTALHLMNTVCLVREALD